MFYATNAQKPGCQPIESSLKQIETEEITQADRLCDAIADCVLSGEFEPGRRLDEGMPRRTLWRLLARRCARRCANWLLQGSSRSASAWRDGGEGDAGAVGDAVRRDGRDRGDLRAVGGGQHVAIERRRLQSLHDGMAAIVERDDREAYVAANVVFHSQIYLGAHNEVLADIARGPAPARGALPRRRAVSHGGGGSPVRTPKHAAVVKALLACDAAAAHAAMLHHMSLVEDSFGLLDADPLRRREGAA